MKEAHPLVNDAYRLIRKKRYRDAVPVLEKVTSSRPSEPYFYFLLACAYLHSGELARVELLVKRARSLRQDYLPALRLEAFLLLKSSADAGPVISRYLDIAQRYPNDRIVKRAMEALRGENDFPALQRSARFAHYVDIPSPPKNGSRKVTRPHHRIRARLRLILLITGAIMTAALLAILVYHYRVEIRELVAARLKDKTAASVPDYDRMVPDRTWGELVEKGKKTEYVYSNAEELARDFNAARRFMKDERYNDALQKLNRLLNANSSPVVKEKAEFLRSFILAQDERVPERLSFAEVAAKPLLYHGCMVTWNGVVADLKRKDEKMIFSMLMQKAPPANGIVDVYSPENAITVRDGDAVEVTGLFMSAAQETRLYVEARSVKADMTGNNR
ncbi:MAG: hypothetical protein EPN93_19155 [Spirochaetes bacterium]|nr:MAG: hypothetical protein EPN93_19155 [Spirochaetota bacterium]